MAQRPCNLQHQTGMTMLFIRVNTRKKIDPPFVCILAQLHRHLTWKNKENFVQPKLLLWLQNSTMYTNTCQLAQPAHYHLVVIQSTTISWKLAVVHLRPRFQGPRTCSSAVTDHRITQFRNQIITNRREASEWYAPKHHAKHFEIQVVGAMRSITSKQGLPSGSIHSHGISDIITRKPKDALFHNQRHTRLDNTSVTEWFTQKPLGITTFLSDDVLCGEGGEGQGNKFVTTKELLSSRRKKYALPPISSGIKDSWLGLG